MFRFLKIVALAEIMLLGGISYDYFDANIKQNSYYLCPNNKIYTDSEHKLLKTVNSDLSCKEFNATRSTYQTLKALSDIEDHIN
mgnify:CR=1 FL=1|jgi:hypothetical protein